MSAHFNQQTRNKYPKLIQMTLVSPHQLPQMLHERTTYKLASNYLSGYIFAWAKQQHQGGEEDAEN